MAPNYGEESKNPKKNVPRAMYISVIGLGIFYILTSWAPFAGYPTVNAAALQAQSDPAKYYLHPGQRHRRPLGWLDPQLPDHHRLVRLRDGVPQHHGEVRILARPRGPAPPSARQDAPRYKSPHIASIAQSVVAALIVLGFAIFTGTDDPNSQAYVQLYGLMAVMGVIIILAIQALVSLSIFIYFERHPQQKAHWWKTRIAPAIAFITQGYVVYLLFGNLSFLGSRV